MSTSELITPQHLARKAIIYVRQSTPHQALSHQESLRLQYALEQRAIGLGWRPEDVVVVDADIGVSAASADAARRLQGGRGPGHVGPGRASSSPTTSPAWPATARIGIRCSMCAATGAA